MKVIKLDVSLTAARIDQIIDGPLSGTFPLKAVLFAAFTFDNAICPMALTTLVKPIMDAVAEEMDILYKDVGRVFMPLFTLRDDRDTKSIVIKVLVPNKDLMSRSQSQPMERAIVQFNYTLE